MSMTDTTLRGSDAASPRFASASLAARPRLERLARYLEQAETIILTRQDPDTGLLPASTAITVHGDYTHAWVRDNVYSILAIWALALALRHEAPECVPELEDRVVRLMRGLLAAMMRQADKVERFKHTQDPLDALHAKYSTRSGEPVVGDAEWGHLQLDATAIYLLILTQMSASGLRIVQSRTELNFVQNLVWYLSHAWRTPDYGIWERGHKQNDGRAEINASSVGMAKAALDAVNGMVFLDGAPSIHVPADVITQARHTLEGLLPRESESKETDAALLSVIGFPAYAVSDAKLAERTRTEIVTKLQGRYGCKRFLLDGHQTVLEDHSRLHYEPGELELFRHIESEWPLFFCYLLLDAALRGDMSTASDYRARLEGLMVEQTVELPGGPQVQRLLPELYFVPEDAVEAERAEPHSQPRVPNANVPLVWAQSLYLVGVLVQEGYVRPQDLLPRGRYIKRVAQQADAPVQVQIALLAADALVQGRLAAHGIEAETVAQVPLLQVRYAEDLGLALTELGREPSLALSGRPHGRLGALTTSQVFLLPQPDGPEQRLLFLPSIYGRDGSHLTLDHHLLVDEIRAEISVLTRHWLVHQQGQQSGQPLLTLLITPEMLDAGQPAVLLDFLRDLGRQNRPDARLGPLHELIASARTARIDWLQAPPWPPESTVPSGIGHLSPYRPSYVSSHAAQDTGRVPVVSDWEESATRPLTPARAAALEYEPDTARLLQRLTQSRNPYEQVELLVLLHQRGAAEAEAAPGCSVRQLTRLFHARASHERQWGLIRRAAGVLDLHDSGLDEAVTQIVARQKRIVVGRSYGAGALITKPLPSAEIFARLCRYGGDDPRGRVLLQEIVLLLGVLIKAEPQLFKGTLTLRPWYLILLITGWLAREHGLNQAEAFDFLLGLSPHAILQRLHDVIAREQEMNRNLVRLQSLQAEVSAAATATDPACDVATGLVLVPFPPEADPVLESDDEADGAGWLAWREMTGVMTRVPKDFYASVWAVLRHFPGIVIGDQLDGRNLLDSRLLRADMTAAERRFALQVEELLDKIHAPEYRQLTIEALRTVALLCRANPGLRADSLLVMDVLVGFAVRIGWERSLPALSPGEVPPDYNEHRAQAWQAFYASPPHRVAELVAAALLFLMRPAGADAP